MRKSTPLVTITCVAYNEEEYIRNTLDGFVMQKTNFPFIALVHDDVSTDNTAKIILEYAKKYPDIIVPIIETENLFSQKKLEKTMNEHIKRTGCKYVAICEGDDWWTDDMKLQKQVDYMESHPNCVMCYTDCDVYFAKDKQWTRNSISNNEMRPMCFIDQLLDAQYIAPMTWLVKRELHGSYDDYEDNHYAMSMDLYNHGDVHFLQDNTAVYCVHDGTVANQRSKNKIWKYTKGIFYTGLEYIKKYNCSDEIKHRFKLKYYLEILPEAIAAKDFNFVKDSLTFYKDNYGVDFTQYIDKWNKYIMYERQYNNISNSKAYRLGRFLLKPLKKFKHK